jgi:TonB family protein
MAWGGVLAQTTAEDYFNRGNAWVEKRDFDRAITDYTQALRINPQLTQPKETLATVERLAANSQPQNTPPEKVESANQVHPVAEGEKTSPVTSNRLIGPSIKSCPTNQEFYPKRSKELNETGAVVLRFMVDLEGLPSAIEVVASSGYRRLDQAAKSVIETCKFRPAMVNGQPRQWSGTFEIVWKLDGDGGDGDRRESAQTAVQDSIKQGDASRQKGDFDQAIAAYNKALSINPQLAEAYFVRGIAWRYKGDNDRAIADFNQALSINPQYAGAYNNRGIAWRNKGDFDRAIADYTQALRINPQDAGAYYNRGNTWGYKGNLDLAIADYNQALSINPRLAEAYTGRGNAWRNKGDHDRSIADYNEALRLEQRLAAELKEKERYRAGVDEWLRRQRGENELAAEAEAERKKRQELEERLASELKE